MGALTRRRAGGWVVVIGLVALALTLGTSPTLPTAQAAPPSRGAAATRPDPAAVRMPDRYLQQKVHWETCDFDLLVRSVEPRAPETRCTRVVVPMDWRHPDDHPDITVAIALSRATGRSQGLLTFNPGGPGIGELRTSAIFATQRPRMFRDFDLLGFDPRGFGDSETALCRGSSQTAAALPAVADPRRRNPATHRAEVSSARFEARGCANELNRFIGTQQTVYDLEFIRAYLQAEQLGGTARYDRLHYIGFSYGTWLGAWYADTYPQHTGRFLLDSNMDWTASMAANQSLDSPAFQRRRDRMFFPWVARHASTYRLGRTAAAVRQRYEKIRAGVLTSFAEGRSPATATDLDRELVYLLYLDADFPLAARTLLDYAELAQPAGARSSSRTDALRPSATRGLPSPEKLRSRPQAAGDDEVVWDAVLAVRCNDSAWSRDIAAVLRRTDADAARYRFIGYWNSLTMCSYWPYPPLTRTVDLAPSPSGEVAPRILMVQSEGDPATGYEGALRAHRATAGRTRLISVQDEGQHGVYLSNVSPCVEKLGDAFLFQGRLPARDTVCSTKPLPRDRRVYPLSGPVRGKPSAAAAPDAIRPRTLPSGEATSRGRAAVEEIRRAAAAAELAGNR